MQASTAPGVPVRAVIASVSVAVEVVVLPQASTMRMDGCVVQATPPVLPPGWVVIANDAAVPATTVNVEEVAPATPGAVAVRA